MNNLSSSILSDYSVAYGIQSEIAEAINSCVLLSSAGYTAYPENARDIDFQIKQNLQKQGLAIIVMTPDLTYIGNYADGSLGFESDEVIIQCTEYVPTNRATTKTQFATALDIGLFLQSYLGSLNNCYFQFGSLNPYTVEQGEDSGLLVVNSKFKVVAAQKNSGGPVIPEAYKTYIDTLSSLSNDGYALSNDLCSKTDLATEFAKYALSTDVSSKTELATEFSKYALSSDVSSKTELNAEFAKYALSSDVSSKADLLAEFAKYLKKTEAYINDGTITISENSITPLTAVPSTYKTWSEISTYLTANYYNNTAINDLISVLNDTLQKRYAIYTKTLADGVLSVADSEVTIAETSSDLSISLPGIQTDDSTPTIIARDFIVTITNTSEADVTYSFIFANNTDEIINISDLDLTIAASSTKILSFTEVMLNKIFVKEVAI